jgi:hypothetical protein
MNRRTNWRVLGAIVAGSATLMQVAHAQEEDRASLELEVGAEHSDNVARVPVDEQSETNGTARLGVVLERVRPRYEAKLNGDVQYRRYSEDTFGSDVVGGLAGRLDWLILPEHFVWVFEDNYGQVTSDPLQADTPDNREQTNFFSTGPDITVPLGARTVLLASGRYSDNYYEESSQGSQSMEGTVGIGRKLAEQTTLSLNGSISEIEYDESDVFPDYTITEGYLRLEAVGARTTVEADAGYTEAERDGQTSDGPLFRLSLTYQITGRSIVSLEAGHVFSDSGTAFRVDQSALGPGSDVNTTLAAGDVFRDTYAYLGFTTERDRGGFSATVFGRKERHEDVIGLDRDIVGADFSALRSLTQRIDLNFEGGYSDESFVVGDVAFQEWFVGLGLGWRLTPKVSLQASVYHHVGSGDGTTRDYEENRAYVGIRYSTGRGAP